MEIINKTNSSFHIFLEDRHIPNPDEILGRSIQYLKSKGNNVLLRGFNQNGTPIVDIDGTLYLFEKTFGIWEGALFTKTNYEVYTEGSCKRRQEVLKYCS